MNYTVTRVLWVAKIVAKIMGTVMRYQHFSFLIKYIRYIDSIKLKVFYRYEFDIVSSDISRISHNMRA